jgi:hypothetical protein
VEVVAADERSSGEYSPSSKAGPSKSAAAFTEPGGSSSSSSSGSKHPAAKADAAAAAAASGQPGTGHEQSPLHIVRAALQVMAMLLLMYLLIDLTAAIVKGKKPVQELLRSLKQIKALLQLMLAPLSMMLVGLLVAVFQYGGQYRPLVTQQGAGRQPAAGAAAAAAVAAAGKGFASTADAAEASAC